MIAERFDSDNIIGIIDKYKDKISIDDYKKLSDLIKSTGDYQVELLKLLNEATERANELSEERFPLVEKLQKASRVLSDFGNLIDKAKEEGLK